jgi:L-Ala-D/L-Glu epimerase
MGLSLSWEVLELRTRDAFHIARQSAPPLRRSVWIRIRDEDGVEGWGEAAATPYYGETAETVTALLPGVATALGELGRIDPLELERLERTVDATVGRNPALKAGVSAALHDLAGKRLGVPVWRLWGLDAGTVPRSSYTIGIDDLEVMREKVRNAAGFPILKLKVGTPRDESILGMVREEAPEAVLRVDANTAWTLKEAIRAIPMLEAHGVEFVEQPLPSSDLEGLRILRRRSRLPILVDESCRTSGDVPSLVGAVDGVNIKLAKCGSLREAVRLVHTARSHGMLVMLGCMIESTLGVAAAAQLSPLVDYLDLDGAALLGNDPFSGPNLAHDGRFELGVEPGLGVERAPSEGVDPT